MEQVKHSSANKVLAFVFILSFLGVLGAVLYRYMYKKDYDYLVEASCDPTTERCFARDCANVDDCPPNGLALYKEWNVKAYDFETCSDNSCKNECESGAISCIPVTCGESEGDECTQLGELE